MPMIKYVCEKCGSDDVSADTASRWNIVRQEWETSSVFDKGAGCDVCGGECRIIEKELTPEEEAALALPKNPDVLITVEEDKIAVFSDNPLALGRVMVWQQDATLPSDVVEVADMEVGKLNGNANAWEEEINVELTIGMDGGFKGFLENFIKSNTEIPEE